MLRTAGEVRVLWARNVLKTLRIPILLFFSLFQPLIFLLLFSQVFAELDRLPGFPYDDYLQFLAPSIIALTALNSAFQSGMGMVTDMEDGLLDKFLISPIRRSSILVGRVLSDGSRIVVQALVIVVVAYAMGTRFETGIAGLAVIVVLVLAIALLFGDSVTSQAREARLAFERQDLVTLGRVGKLVADGVVLLDQGLHVGHALVDVVADGAFEQHHILTDQRDLLTQ